MRQQERFSKSGVTCGHGVKVDSKSEVTCGHGVKVDSKSGVTCGQGMFELHLSHPSVADEACCTLVEAHLHDTA